MPEFQSALEAQDEEDFAIKITLSVGDRAEHIWVAVDRIAFGNIEGRLANQPVDLEGYQLGARVAATPGRVEGWRFFLNGARFARYTDPKPPTGALIFSLALALQAAPYAGASSCD